MRNLKELKKRTSSSHKNVFLFEDEINIADWIKGKIEGLANFSVVSHSSKCEGALEAIFQKKSDIVILDLKLADGNSIGLIQQIKEAAPNIIVIIITINRMAEKACLKYGADYFFDKSKSLTDFFRVLNSIHNGTDPDKSLSR